ncbi:sugar transferase [Rhodoferax sp. AJA081-3]|uniref:sugar transferase n=1 Tax=Rhodoferax sp. AJA081-3 TaxID=2752316 RepID=UPI001FD777FA|nr:sugar transferase [Rhodoferax sp. AJA081-3]
MTMPTTHDPLRSRADRDTLASSTARRQSAQLVWSFAGGITLALSYAIAIGLMRLGWVTLEFAETVLWCTLPYLLCTHWIYRGAGLPSAERTSMLLVTTMAPFLLLMLGFALFHQPYSRGAVLLVYLLCTMWFVAGDRLRKQSRTQRLVCVDPGVADQLTQWCGEGSWSGHDIELHPMPTGAEDVANLLVFDGAILDRRIAASSERSQLLGKLKLSHMRLYSVEAVAELLTGRKMLPTEQDELWELDGNPAYDVIKRAIDAISVLVTAPLWLPLCILVALAVGVSSPGPIFFSQTRVGLNGRSFKIWKFRSMRLNVATEDGLFASPGDSRITPVGQFIRRMRLDELPQFWNVLKGEMSLIGPRPEQRALVDKFATRIPAYPYRHLVRPGITGWAQVLQGYAGNEEETAIKLSYDLYYVAHYSVALDLLIAYKTLRIVASGFGAR